MTAPRARWLLVLWGALGGAVLVGMYLVMVRHGLGQRIDFSAFEGRKWTMLWARRRATLVVQLLTPVTVIVVTAGAALVALRTRGFAAAATAALSVPLVIALARLLKAALPRDELLVGSWITSANTYPSGHTAAIVTVALTAISVSAPRWRAVVSAVALIGVGSHTIGMSGTGWHRPSDLVGGIGLAVMVAGWSAVIITRHAPRVVEPEVGPGRIRGWYREPRSVAAAVGLVIGLGLLWPVALRLLGAAAYGTFTTHLAAVLGALAVGTSVVAVHTVLADAGDGERSQRPGGPLDPPDVDSALR